MVILRKRIRTTYVHRRRPIWSTSMTRVSGASVVAGLLLLLPSTLWAGHVARLDPAEPIFTQRSFVESHVELDVEWSKQSDGDTIELAPSGGWVVWDRLELGMEVPSDVVIPDHGPTVGDLADISFFAQGLLCCDQSPILDYLSLRAEIAPPTGNRSKDIGGDGEWSLSVLPGRYIPLIKPVPDVLAQIQFSYSQQFRLDKEGEEMAREPGVGKTLQKELEWNLAFVQQYLDGRLQPMFEVLGTTVVDAQVSDDEGTIVELGGGFWIAPHPDEHWLSGVSFGVGFKWPVTGRKEDQSVGLFIAQLSFD